MLELAARSLEIIHRDSVLNISHLGLLTDVMDGLKIPQNRRQELLKLVEEKNVAAMEALCADCGNMDVLTRLILCSGTPEEVCRRNGIAQIMGVSLKRSENGYFYQYG